MDSHVQCAADKSCKFTEFLPHYIISPETAKLAADYMLFLAFRALGGPFLLSVAQGTMFTIPRLV
jgi:hypothetical protein